MQPKVSSSRQAEEPVNTKAFVLKKEEDIREDELFFYRYFRQKVEKEKQRKRKTSESDDENSDNTANFDNIEERSSVVFDFASELKSARGPSSVQNKPGASDEEDESDDDVENEEQDETEDEGMAGKEQGSSEDEFDYNDLDFSSAEEEETAESSGSHGKKRKFTEKDYEKALLDNLSSDEFSEDEDSRSTKKKSKKGNIEGNDMSSMFASAEEFAHLLENSKASRGGKYDVMRAGASDKQLKWEEKKAGKSWKVERGLGRGRMKGPQRNSNYRARNRFNSKGKGGKKQR